MDRNRPTGNLKTLGGKALSLAGDLTGNTEARIKGRAAVFAGRSQNAYGQASDYARDIGDDLNSLAHEGLTRTGDYLEESLSQLEDRIKAKPVVAALAAAGVGLLIALLLPTKR